MEDALLGAYASLFVHRWDQYALQQRDGSYWRIAEPLTLDLLAAHLLGRCTLGTYLLDVGDSCQFAVFDADGDQGLEQLAGLASDLLQEGIPTTLEASRRGGHLWLHLQTPTAARAVRSWLLPFASTYGVELYPKQDGLLPGGSGSLIRLPLSVHRKSRHWYPFVTCSPDGILLPVGETVVECCQWLCERVVRVMVPEQALVHETRGGFCPVTGENGGVSRAGVVAPARGAIRAWCLVHDIEAVIGRFVSLDRRGVGSCPFNEHHRQGDVHPSFQVFGGDNPHWYCYTWGRAGDLFDFLCLYYRLTPQEGWARLQRGELL